MQQQQQSRPRTQQRSQTQSREKFKAYEEGYEVNIELKDQVNNIFYIDNINDSNSIVLKDGKFTKTGSEAKSAEQAANKETTETDTEEEIAARLEEKMIDSSSKKISIFRDIYYLDNTVIQDLRTIFIKHLDRDLKKGSGYDYDYNDPREPIDIDKVKDLMEGTNKLSEFHKIFTNEDYCKTIKDNLIHFNSGTNSRVKQLNSRDAINRYIVDYHKYINNSKKTDDFDDDEKMDALMFYNVMYLLKNIYLKKQTILTNIQGEKYYVDEILFYDLPYIHMVKKDYDKPKKINIYLRLKTIAIIDIPIIKIHYIVDDLELQSLKLSAPREFKPSDLDKDFAKYNTMYIFDMFKYKQETDSMAAFFNSLKREKRIDKIQELFFNADIVNKYKKRYSEQHNLKKIYEQEKKKDEEKRRAENAEKEKEKKDIEVASAITDLQQREERLKKLKEKAEKAKTAKDKKNEKEDQEKKKKKEDEDIKKISNINANILYLLRQNFNLIDNKISIDNTTIDDTYIAYDISNNDRSTITAKYHSIMTNKKYDNYDNPKKEEIIKNIITEHVNRFGVKYDKDNFFYIDNRTDKRFTTTVYNIIVIFRTYKLSSTKKTPSLTRRYIGDECLSNAVTLDSIFSKLFYRSFGLPDKYLYDKLANISNKISGNSYDNTAGKSNLTIAPNIPGLPTIPNSTKGGKKHNTKKFRTKKFRTKKHITRKYRKNRFGTKKVRTKIY
jgi:hypothetical protein